MTSSREPKRWIVIDEWKPGRKLTLSDKEFIQAIAEASVVSPVSPLVEGVLNPQSLVNKFTQSKHWRNFPKNTVKLLSLLLRESGIVGLTAVREEVLKLARQLYWEFDEHKAAVHRLLEDSLWSAPESDIAWDFLLTLVALGLPPSMAITLDFDHLDFDQKYQVENAFCIRNFVKCWWPESLQNNVTALLKVYGRRSSLHWYKLLVELLSFASERDQWLYNRQNIARLLTGFEKGWGWGRGWASTQKADFQSLLGQVLTVVAFRLRNREWRRRHRYKLFFRNTIWDLSQVLQDNNEAIDHLPRVHGLIDILLSDRLYARCPEILRRWLLESNLSQRSRLSGECLANLFEYLCTEFSNATTTAKDASASEVMFDLERLKLLSQKLAALEDLLIAEAGLDEQKFYRDHVTHMIRVALLASFLMSQIEGTALPALVRRNTRVEIEIPLLLAALYHDVAYPLAEYYEIMETLRTTLVNCYEVMPIPAQAPDDSTVQAVASLWQTIRDNMSQPAKSALPEGPWHPKRLPTGLDIQTCKHNILGAIDLYQLMSKTWSSSSVSSTAKSYLMQAIEAVALHHSLEDKSQRGLIKFADLPVSFLLIVCDELQDWGRRLGGGDSQIADFEPEIAVKHVESGVLVEAHFHFMTVPERVAGFSPLLQLISKVQGLSRLDGSGQFVIDVFVHLPAYEEYSNRLSAVFTSLEQRDRTYRLRNFYFNQGTKELVVLRRYRSITVPCLIYVVDPFGEDREEIEKVTFGRKLMPGAIKVEAARQGGRVLLRPKLVYHGRVQLESSSRSGESLFNREEWRLFYCYLN